MKRKMVALLAAALMTISFAGTALASFGNGELIRVVYDTVGTKEYATDLGNWATITGLAATGNQTVGGGTDAITLANFGGTTTWSNLVVGYFLVDSTVGANQTAVAGDAGGLNSGTRKFTGFSANAAQASTTYTVNAAAGANSVTLADKTAVNSYYTKLDSAGVTVGGYGSWVTVANPGGTKSLAALATTGFVEQTIYSWTGVNLASSGVLPGTAAFTLQTMADGSTILNAGAAAAPVPVPPAFFLMGSGLLGIFGVRRKMNA